MNNGLRSALMGSAISAIAGTAALVGIAAPASAACTITTTVNPGDTYSCANTTTTDTTGLSGTDRNVPYDTTGIPLYVTVGAGVTVDGFGMAFTDVATGTNGLSVTNDGAIVVDAANTPTAGGSSAALYISSVNTPIFYYGTGSVTNSGTGHGVQMVATGAGTPSITYANTGAVTSTTGNAVDLTNSTGNILVQNTGNLTAAAAGGIGLNANNAGAGATNIVTLGTINADLLGISATTVGTGVVNVTANGAITVANGDGIAATSTTGDLTVTNANTGAITANNGDGIVTVSTTGNQQVNVQAAISAGGLGVSETSTSGNLGFFNNAAGTVTSAGDAVTLTTGGAGTVTVVQNGAVTSNGGDAIVTTSVDGNQTISGSANIVAAANGIDATATGLGTVSINRTGGTITSIAGDGIQVDTTSGSINVTTGAITASAGNGVQTTSTTGNQTITASGAISSSAETILASSTSGNMIVNVNANLTTTGAGDVVSTDTSGTATVNVAAGRTVTGGGGDVINFYGTGTGTLNNSGVIGDATSNRAVYSDSTEQVTVNNLAGGVINGNYDLSDLGDTITNSGTLNLRAVSNFYTGTDVITNNAGGTINVAAGTTLTGLETLNNAGTLTAATGLTFDGGATALTNTGTFNLAGTLDLGAGADSFANSGAGILNITGATTIAGAETVTNTGRINLNTFTLTGPAIAFTNSGFIDTNGSAGLAGFTTFSNAGTLDLAAGTYTAPAGLFTNSGLILADEGAATITGQSSFANSGTIDLQDGATGDVLTINSAFAGSGGSTLLLDVDDAIADQLVITGAASGSTTIDANLIGTGILNPGGVLLVDAASASVGAFVLGNVSGNTSPLLDYSLAQNGGDFLLVTAINAAGFAPVPVTLIAGDMWYKSAEAVWAQNKLPSDGTNRMGIWGQIYAGREKAGGNDGQTINGVDYDVDNRLTTDHLGFQAGYGFPLGAMGSVGVTAGLGRADIDGNASGYKTKSYNIGAYGTFGGPAGIYGSVLAKHDRFDIDIDNSLFESVSPDGRSNGIDGEVGYRFGAVSGPVFGVNAGLSHVRTKLDDFSLAGLEYDYDSVTSTRGRVGVRATGSGPISPFIDVRAYREFSGDGDIRLSDGVDTYRLHAEGRGTWARIEAGVGGPASGIAPMVSAWVDFGDVKGFGGRGSFRF